MNMHLTVDRYLRGTLAEDEKARFEERLLWDDELADELDLAEHLREGLRASAKRDDFTTARASVVDRLSSLLFVPQYAAAASFLLAMTLTAGVFMSPLNQDDVGAGGYTTQTEIVPLIAVRGSTAQVIVVKHNNWTVLLVDVTGSHDHYRVSVAKDEDGAEPFWLQDGLATSYPDALAIGMPGSALATGYYVLSVEGVRVVDQGTQSYDHIQDIRFTTATTD